MKSSMIQIVENISAFWFRTPYVLTGMRTEQNILDFVSVEEAAFLSSHAAASSTLSFQFAKGIDPHRTKTVRFSAISQDQINAEFGIGILSEMQNSWSSINVCDMKTTTVSYPYFKQGNSEIISMCSRPIHSEITLN